MKDIKSFCKLFDLNMPVYEHYEYYIKQFSKINRWAEIDKLISLFEKAELEIDDMFEYKIKKTNEIISFLKTTRAYNELNDDNLLDDLPCSKNFEFSEGVNYLSLDIRMANWQVLKKYDPSFLNELGDSYVSLLRKFDVPEVFHNSKHFRQYIFGNLNPKRQIRAQRIMIQDIINGLANYNLKIECIKNDEVIYSYTNPDQVLEIINNLDHDDFLKAKTFNITRADNFRINNYLDLNNNVIHKELVGCNGNKFFYYLKKHILIDEEMDIRDLYFRVDGDIAIWNIEGLRATL